MLVGLDTVSIGELFGATGGPFFGPCHDRSGVGNFSDRVWGVSRDRYHQRSQVAVVLLAVLVAGGLRAFVVQSFFVPSGSMLPTLQIGDRIIVTKVNYTIHRGDIIVFRRTPADTSTTDADLVKRVIGLPGETISSRGATCSSTASRSPNRGCPV